MAPMPSEILRFEMKNTSKTMVEPICVASKMRSPLVLFNKMNATMNLYENTKDIERASTLTNHRVM